MLSGSQDTNTILYWLNKWLVSVGIKPKEAVSGYSKALLGGISLSFNNFTLKDYMQECILFITNQKSGGRPAGTFIRVHVHGKLRILVVAIFEWSQGYGIVFNTIQGESWSQVYT